MDIGTFFTETLRPETEHIIRITAALILGGLVGLEREVRDKPAGLRTIILICVGACIFTIVSQVVGGPDAQHTRIAAQIVSGIGFLGAGAILRDRASVIGLTTAATIWAVAAIGMAVGFGHYALGLVGTGGILTALLVLDVVENWVGDRRDIQEYHFMADNADDMFDRVARVFTDAKLNVRKRTCHEEGKSLVFHIVAMGSKVNHERLQRTLARSKDYTLRAA